MIFNIAPGNLYFFLFADDTNVLYPHENLKTLELIVNIELKNLFNWLIENKLTLTERNQTLLFSAHSKKDLITCHKLTLLTMKKIRILPLNIRIA